MANTKTNIATKTKIKTSVKIANNVLENIEQENPIALVEPIEKAIEGEVLPEDKDDYGPCILPTSIENAREHLIDFKKFSSRIEKRMRDRKKLLIEDQKDAIQCLLAAYAHENYDYMTKLWKSIHQQSEAMGKQIKEFFITNAPVYFTTTKDGNYTFRKDKKEGAKQFNFENAHKNPWFKIKLYDKEDIKSLFKATSFEDTLKRLITKAEGALKDPAKLENPSEASIIKAKLAKLKHFYADEIVTQTAPSQETTSEQAA